jgi:hypothetical protein
MNRYITYRALRGYRYALLEQYSHVIPIVATESIVSSNGWIGLTTKGLLIIKTGYAWDGPSGPLGRLNDTDSFMRPSLEHDALYQLMREGLLDQANRIEADMLLRQHCIEDGMSTIRAAYVYQAVRWFGASSASPANVHPLRKLTAP